MRCFTMHDGEDENKTAELHDFLTPLKSAGGDWEGDNHGITIWMPPVNVGDVIVLDHDGLGVRIYPKGEPVKITRENFPWVYRAMLEVEYDNGAHHANRISPGTVDLDVFTMPFDYGVQRLIQANEDLMNLHEHDEKKFGELVAGDVDTQDAIVKEFPVLVVAHDLLNDWFNGWPRPYGWEEPSEAFQRRKKEAAGE